MRELGKDKAKVDEWLPEIAPATSCGGGSDMTRAAGRSFAAAILPSSPAKRLCSRLYGKSRQGNITLLFAARDPEHNNAVALRDYLQEEKPEAAFQPGLGDRQ